MWITVDWTTNKLQIDRASGRSIGGAARLGRFVLAPVLRGENFFLLSRKEGEIAWSECKTSFDPKIVYPQLRRQENQQAYLGIPVVDENRMVVYWPARGGYLKVQEAGSSSEHAWEFHPWETDDSPATALIELGPPYRKIGSRSGYWQLCEDKDPSRREGIKQDNQDRRRRDGGCRGLGIWPIRIDWARQFYLAI